MKSVNRAILMLALVVSISFLLEGHVTPLALAIVWQRRFHSIAWRKLWGMIPWIPRGSMSNERNRIYSTW